MTTDEELQRAAENYKQNKIKSSLDDKYDAWLEGAKSPESLEYWKEKEKLYTEEEVRGLCKQAFIDGQSYGVAKTREPDYYIYQDSPLKEWFNQHKK